jgi:flagellar M-ring protein FliF
MAIQDSIKSIPSSVTKFFKNMEKGKKVRLIIFAVLVLAIAIALTVFLNQKTYTVLYSGMTAQDTGAVLTVLGEMGVDAKSEGEDTVLVSDSEVDKIRLELAAQGYPSSGMNYDIYGSASGLGTTDSEKQVYYKYQLQANLRSTIMQMSKVENADVYIDLGQDSLFVFSDNEKPATASIMLTLRDGEKLDSQEVKAIMELVSKSVSGLEPENIRIVDAQMTLYTAEDETEIGTADSQLTLTKNVQEQLQTQIVNLLSPVFGEDNVLAQVSVKLNFDSHVEESVEYSTPEGSTDGIVVSMQELVEAIANDSDGGVSGIDANGGASQYIEAIGENENAVYYNVSREVNYEVNQTTTQIEKAKGQIESLSVSVILDSINIDDYVDKVKNLVATAIGAPLDNITVERLPFEAAQAEAEESAQVSAEAQAFEQQLASMEQRERTLRLGIVAGAVLAIIIFVFAIVRTLRPKKIKTAAIEGIDILVGNEADMQLQGDENRELEIKDKDKNIKVLEDYIAKNPEAAAGLLRNWLNEG